MSYGLKLYNTDGEIKILTPDDGTIIAAGSKTMSNSLEGDNTYGEDIALGATYDEDEISVLVVPRRPVYGVTYNRYIDSTLYYNTFYLDSAKTYYTRNTSTGVMTSFSAGNKTVNNKSTWNPVLSVFPIAFWDKKGASTFSSVRLFAATAYLIRDPNNDTNFSLAGSANGSGGIGGGNGDTVNNIKDNNLATWYGDGCGVQGVNPSSCYWDYSAEVSFSSKTITIAQMYHRPYGYIQVNGTARANWKLFLYYSSAWHEIYADNFYLVASSGGAEWDEGVIDTKVTGHWKGVTKIKVEASGEAHGPGYVRLVLSEHVTYELKAWGPASSDADENKIVYSVGNQGIITVDYMICRKRYT